MELLKDTLAKKGMAFATYFEKPKLSPAQTHAQKMANKYAMPKLPKSSDICLENAVEWWHDNMSLISATSTRVQRINGQYLITVMIDDDDMDAITEEDWHFDLVAPEIIDYSTEDEEYENWLLGKDI